MPETTPKTDALLTADQNRRMFDEIVPHYDRLNGLLSLGLHRRWRRRAVTMLAPVAGALYLDVGTGTGDLCVEVLRQEPAARTIGIDPSPAMLEQARSKFERLKLGERAQVAVGDACNLEYKDAHFDGIVSGFCIRNVTDRAQAFREMHRVIVPNARVVLLELTRPTQSLLRLGHHFYGRAVVPLLGRMMSRGDAYRYLTKSIEAFTPPQTIVAELRGAGFVDVSATALTSGVVTVFCAQRSTDMPGEDA